MDFLSQSLLNIPPRTDLVYHSMLQGDLVLAKEKATCLLGTWATLVVGFTGARKDLASIFTSAYHCTKLNIASHFLFNSIKMNNGTFLGFELIMQSEKNRFLTEANIT